MRKSAQLLVLLLSSIGLVSAHTAAAAKPPPHGITLSPAIVNLAIQNSDSQKQINFTLTNNETTPQSINLSTRDFNTLNETGGLFFVGANPTQLQKKYGLANWISLPQTNFSIAPKQTVVAKAFVLNRPDLAPGGHYGAMMVTLQPPNSALTKPNQVSLEPIASALLFINKVGGALYHLKLTDVYASHTFWKLPKQVTLRFQNTGNTHLTPRGTVDIYGPGGKHVSHGVINDSSGIILPQTGRRYSVNLNQISPTSAPGKYKLVVNYRFDGYEQSRSYQTSVWLFTPLSVIVVLPVIALGVLSFRQSRSPKRRTTE